MWSAWHCLSGRRKQRRNPHFSRPSGASHARAQFHWTPSDYASSRHTARTKGRVGGEKKRERKTVVCTPGTATWWRVPRRHDEFETFLPFGISDATALEMYDVILGAPSPSSGSRRQHRATAQPTLWLPGRPFFIPGLRTGLRAAPNPTATWTTSKQDRGPPLIWSVDVTRACVTNRVTQWHRFCVSLDVIYAASLRKSV